MRFGKRLHHLNFDYGERLTVTDTGVRLSGPSGSAELRCAEITGFCLRLTIDNARVADKRQYSQGIREAHRQGRPVPPAGGLPRFHCGAGRVDCTAAGLRVELAEGGLLETLDQGLGFNGEQLILNFRAAGVRGVYGAGERTRKLNKSGDSLDFWNVDVVAEYPHGYQRDDYDPAYVSIPLLILKTADAYLGLYFDNPGRALLDVGNTRPGVLCYQSLAGNTDLYLINGPTLRNVVRNFTELTGRHELPPLWSLGYHQCRWGYQTEAEFLELKDLFARHDIPVSVLWHDIDYMDGYRVFTWNREEFPDPARLGAALKAAGIRSVTIVDPGVKLEPGYPVYDDGRRQDAFCKTGNGRDFVGVVWPGDTVFPDFSRAPVRDWWAGWLRRFLAEGSVDGAWLDMNEPATVPIHEDDMLFENGAVAHHRYHNQYGLLMAMASRGAFDERTRPFLLTRSAFTGIQRYAAVWTGDNCSNWGHLRMSIPATLNLGLSGVAFNGPDVGGFMGHTTPELLSRWYQAGFLFPFFRNHSMRDSKTQEPWQFGDECLRIARDAIRTRYRLLPYIYTLFFEHWLTGDPVLRPVLYEFDGEELENLDEQYLLGDALMAAPIVHGEGADRVVVQDGVKRHLRYVTFPPGWWYDLNRGAWIRGGGIQPYAAALDETPLFARDGAAIPWYPGPLTNGHLDWSRLELHLFCRERPAGLTLYLDDRESRNYLQGTYNAAYVTAAVERDLLRLSIDEEGCYPKGSVDFTPVLYGHDGLAGAEACVNGQRRALALRPATRRWLGRELAVLAGG